MNKTATTLLLFGQLVFATTVLAQPSLNQTAIAGLSLSKNATLSTIRNLEMAQHYVLQASNNFFLLQTSETNKNTKEEIKSLLLEAEQLINGLPTETNQQKSDALLVTIKNVWPELKNKILSKIDPQVDPFDPFDSVSADTYMRSIIFSMTESINTLRELSGLDGEESTFKLSNQTRRIRHINTCYSAIALQSGEANTSMDRRDLDKLSHDFELTSQSLLDQFKDNRQVAKKIQEAYQSWKIINQAIQNTQDEPVPFLVSKYSEQIVKDLNQALIFLHQ